MQLTSWNDMPFFTDFFTENALSILSWNTMRSYGVCILLLCNSIRDIRKKEILLIPTAAAGAAGLFAAFVLQEPVLTGILPSLLPGILLLFLSRFTGEKIGYGDGILTLTLGIWRGLSGTLLILAGAFWLASGTAIFLLIRRSVRKELPFVPFLFLSCLITDLLVK